jgi:hypothetical protein
MPHHPLAGVVGLEADLDPVFSRLYSRFRIEAGAPAFSKASLLAPVVVPITNMDALLAQSMVERQTTTIASTGNFTTILTVPVGKRWQLYYIQLIQEGGTWNWDRERYHDTSLNVSFTVQSYASPVTSANFQPNTPWPMDQLDEYQIDVGTFSSGGNIQVNALIVQEDAY